MTGNNQAFAWAEQCYEYSAHNIFFNPHNNTIIKVLFLSAFHTWGS